MEDYLQDYEKRVHAAYLAHCSASEALQWLRDRRHREEPGTGVSIEDCSAQESPVLEYLLLRRREPLIDLGLAQYGHSLKFIRKVFDRGNAGVRCAALTNPHIGPKGYFEDGWLAQEDLVAIALNGPKSELQAVMENPWLDDELLVELLQRKHPFDAIEDERFLEVLRPLSRNPRMSAPFDINIYDGYAEFCHNKVFSAAWELARSLPVTVKVARVLDQLLRNTTVPRSVENAEDVIKRWHIETESGSEPFVAELLRARLADAVEPGPELFESDDASLRRSFYSRLSPLKYPDWPEFVDRDGGMAYEALLENDKLWENPEERERLRRVAWQVPDPQGDMIAPGTFAAVRTRKLRQHPEWFTEEG